MQRIEHPDVIYRDEKDKYNAVADEIERGASLGRAGARRW